MRSVKQEQNHQIVHELQQLVNNAIVAINDIIPATGGSVANDTINGAPATIIILM
jgi:hypothetical protein